MELYGIWNKDDGKLDEYGNVDNNNIYHYTKFFGTKKEIQDEIDWLNEEAEGNADIYFAVAVLNTSSGCIELKEIFDFQ